MTTADLGESITQEAGGESASGGVIEATGGQVERATEPSEAKSTRLSSFFSPPGSEQGGDEEAAGSSAASSSDTSSSGGTNSSSGGGSSSSSSDGEEEDETGDGGTDGSSDGTSSEGTGSSDGSDESSSDDDEDEQDGLRGEARPKFEPIVDGVTVEGLAPSVTGGCVGGGTGAGGAEGKEEDGQSQTRAPAEASAVHQSGGECITLEPPSTLGRRTSNLGRSSSFSDSLDEFDRQDQPSEGVGKDHQQQEGQQQERDYFGASSPPRPVIAGPAATQVPAILGGERGAGFCAAAAREKLVAARKARANIERERDRSTLERADKNFVVASTPNAALNLEPDTATKSSTARANTSATAETAAPAQSISATTSPVSAAGRGAPTGMATMASSRNQPPETYTSYSSGLVSDDEMPPASLPSSVLGELLRTLVAVDAAGRGGADWSASGTAGSRRQGRVRLMEDAKRLIAGEMAKVTPGGRGKKPGQLAVGVRVSVSADAPGPARMGELVGVLLRLTDDPDFKIVRQQTRERRLLLASTLVTTLSRVIVREVC